MSWLERYRAGERDAVWHELRQAGSKVRDPRAADDAQAVCDEVARRARQNVEIIIERLRNEGYVFHTNDDAQTPVVPHLPPGRRAEDVLDWLGNRFEHVPMTLVSWLRHVGDVWLVGTHPDWPESSSADPLVVELEGSRYEGDSIVDYFEDELNAFEEEAGDGAAVLFELPAAPDRLHKENVSGGAPYGFVLPDGCADAMFSAEVTIPFVPYLRWVFSRGGFPVQTGTTPEEWRVRSQLAHDLLPL
jgi:hypothetical protein